MTETQHNTHSHIGRTINLRMIVELPGRPCVYTWNDPSAPPHHFARIVARCDIDSGLHIGKYGCWQLALETMQDAGESPTALAISRPDAFRSHCSSAISRQSSRFIQTSFIVPSDCACAPQFLVDNCESGLRGTHVMLPLR
eukprot:6475675-Pyramimonas_sp.AAC.1